MVFLTYQPLVITHHSGPEVRKPRILILDEAMGEIYFFFFGGGDDVTIWKSNFLVKLARHLTRPKTPKGSVLEGNYLYFREI